MLAVVAGDERWGLAAIDRKQSDAAAAAAVVIFEYRGWEPRALALTADRHARILWMERPDDGVLTDVPLSDGAAKRLLDVPRLRAHALSPDGTQLAWAPVDRAGAHAPVLGWWSGATAPVELLPPGDYTDLSFAADGKRLAAVSHARGAASLAIVESHVALPGRVALPGGAAPALDSLMTRAAATPPAPAAFIDVVTVPHGKQVHRIATPAPAGAREELAFGDGGATLFFTRTTRTVSGRASHHVTVDLWAAGVTAHADAAPRKAARIFDGEIPFVD